MNNRIKLTTTAIDKLRFPEDDERAHIILWDTQTPGLGLRLSKSGTKTYFFQRRVKGGSGKERNITLARHGDPVLLPDGTLRPYRFGAEDARIRAAAVLAQLLAGVDPVAEQERKEAETAARAEQDKALSTTLRQVMAHYFENHRVKGRPLRPKTKREYRTFMEGEKNFADWLDEPVAGITRDKCLVKITEIEKRSQALAHKASTYLRLFLNHAREMHATDDSYPILAVNPVGRARKIKATHPPQPRDRRIPAEKVGAVWLMLRRRAANAVRELDRTAADWVSTLLLTGWRLTECAALEWSWISFDAKTITLPGDVDTDDEHLFAGVKNHRGVTYPMSDALRDIMKARSELESRNEIYVFPSRAGTEVPYVTTAHGTMSEVSKVAGTHLSPHDLRRTAEDAALACRVDYSLRQRLLNHTPVAVHDSSYGNDPSPEILRPAVNAIANYILDAARLARAQQDGSNVIAFPSQVGA